MKNILIIAACLVAPLVSLAQIPTVSGVDSLHYRWTPSTGQVAAYRVEICRNDLECTEFPETIWVAPSDSDVHIPTHTGELLNIRVVAYNLDGSHSMTSPASGFVQVIEEGGLLTGTGINTDSDGDGLLDRIDNCIEVPNSDQIDSNSNGFGDVCDTPTAKGPSGFDFDQDGIANSADNCIRNYNPDQSDEDDNHLGDACEGLFGDINRDKKITVVDTNLFLQYTNANNGLYHSSLDCNMDYVITLIEDGSCLGHEQKDLYSSSWVSGLIPSYNSSLGDSNYRAAFDCNWDGIISQEDAACWQN